MVDRNRVAEYLKSQRGPNSGVSGLDVGLFVRGIADPSTSEDDVRRDYEQRIAAGESDDQIGANYVTAGQKEHVRSFTQRRTDAMKQYTDANERSKATSEAETGGQTVARILADMASAYAGGKPGAISEMIRKHRETERARSDKLAGDTLAFELGGIDAEREDARAAATLEASRNEREATRTFTAGENEANRRNQRDIATGNQTAQDTRADKSNTTRIDAARIAAGAKVDAAGAKPPTEDENKAASFFDLATEGERSIAASGYDATRSTGRVERELPPEGQSPEFQRYRQGVRLFAAAWLRRISGAAVTPEEIDEVDLQFFPQPGEDKSLIEQKRSAREVVLKGLKRTAGRALKAQPAGDVSTSGGGAGPTADGAAAELARRRAAKGTP